MAGAALLDHLGLEARHFVLLDRMRGVAVGATRRGEHAVLAQLAVHPVRPGRALGLVARAAGVGHLRTVRPASLLALREDAVRAVAVRAGRRRALRGALQRLAVDAVVELAGDVAARQLALRHRRLVAVAARAGGFDVGVARARRRILRAQDVVSSVAIGAGGGDVVPALARLAVDRSAVFLHRCSWQVAQLTGFSFSACGILSAETSVWQSVHLRLRLPCTDAANFAPSTAIDLPSAPFASAAAVAHEARLVDARRGRRGHRVGFGHGLAKARMAQTIAPAARMMIGFICCPAGLRMGQRSGGPAADAPM